MNADILTIKPSYATDPGKKPCPGCAHRLDLLTPEKITALAAEIRIEPSDEASEDVYQNRIAVCNECEALQGNVLCFHCGCFIFFRARSAQNYCPHPIGDKWKQ